MVHEAWRGGIVRPYVLSGRDGLLVVDVGSHGAAEDAAALIRRLPGYGMADVRLVLCTHFHIDHVGGIGRFLAGCPSSTRVGLPARAGAYIAGKAPLCAMRNWRSGFLPAAIACLSAVRRPSHLFVDGPAGIPLPGLRSWTRTPWPRERISFVGFPERGRESLAFDDWEVISTPGHTEDSVSFYCPSTGELLCGDLILHLDGRGRGALNRFCWREDVSRDTLDRLRRTTKTETVYPGHGPPLRGEDVLGQVRPPAGS